MGSFFNADLQVSVQLQNLQLHFLSLGNIHYKCDSFHRTTIADFRGPDDYRQTRTILSDVFLFKRLTYSANAYLLKRSDFHRRIFRRRHLIEAQQSGVNISTTISNHFEKKVVGFGYPPVTIPKYKPNHFGMKDPPESGFGNLQFTKCIYFIRNIIREDQTR